MKLQSPEQELQFLQDFQKKLHQDRKTETGNASPLYYGILDYVEVVTQDGYEDFVSIVDTDEYRTMSVEDILDELSDYTDVPGVNLDDKHQPVITDEAALLSYAEDIGIILRFPMQKIWKPVEDAVFFTREAAQQHLTANHYHYHPEAHTYAMTACRSPEYEHVLELLHSIDWEHSQIQLLDTSHT